VRVALLGELGPPPDLVVSGINYGANMGNDVTYSGTVGAALEAALHRVPGVAVSVESREPEHLATGLPLLHGLIRQLLRAPLPTGTALNVNLPERPASQFAGIKVTSLGGSSCHDRVILESDFEVSGEHWLHCERAPLEPWSSSDFDAIEQGFVSLTPIHYELTSREGLAALAAWMLDDLIEAGAVAADDADEAARVRAEAEAAGAYAADEGTLP
jgi:5'-nucleotidase